MNRVVITGIGAVTPLGLGKDELWKSLLEGKSGIGPITRFNTDEFEVKIAAEVKDFDSKDYLDKREAKRMDRFTQYAVVAAMQAMEDGNIPLDKIDLKRAGVILGTGRNRYPSKFV